MTPDTIDPAAYSRRSFLRRSAGLVLAAGLAPTAWLAGCAPRVAVRRGAPWDGLASNLRGALLRPGNPDYLRHALPWNRRFARALPGGIARCVDRADVQTSLRWAEDHGVPLAIRSGGHSYAGFSTTTGLMIDVSPMNQVTFDPSTGRATLGGGARNGDVYAKLRVPSVAITHGRCKAVGVSGLVLGGGIGFNMRAHGLTCDQLLETGIILADGTYRMCSPTENADLFWACRGGGGGNFGIHTSFTLQTFPVGQLTAYEITWTDRVDEVLAALQDVALSSPDTLGGKVSVNARRSGSRNVLNVQLLGQLSGPPADLRDLLAPVYAVAHPGTDNERIQPGDYWEGQEFLSEDGTPGYSHERSRYVTERLSDAGLASIMRHMRSWPGTSVGATWKVFLMGGEVSRRGPSDTAYVHRAATMISSIEVEWDAGRDGPDVVSRNEEWLDGFHAAMRQYASDRCYQNFIDASQTDWPRAYYGANFERLVEIKRKYDRDNVFHFPQSIPVS